MPTVTGRVFYDQARRRTGYTGIENVPVCLYDTTNAIGIVAITNSSGQFVFNNVPDGNYSLIECYGTAGAPSPVSFSTAAPMLSPKPADPPISFVSPPIAGANKLDSLTPNTMFITVAGGNIVNKNFYDGPIEYRPLAVFAGTPIGPNLITNANNGNWGDLPDGTPINSVAPTNEYPGMLSGLNYGPTFPPYAGNVCYDNIPDGYPGCWYVADHTTGMETGRMIVVDGANTGAVFFEETVTLKANSHYALTMWIVNMNNPTAAPLLTPPRIGITVVDADGTVLYREILQELPQANPPQWTQIGGLFYNTLDTSATISISTESTDPSGNDFSIDDIVFTEVDISDALTVEKSASQCPATIGETVTYTVTVTNTIDTAANSVQFQDVLAANVTFVTGSVTVDNTPYDDYDPATGFLVGDMPPDSSHLIAYQVTVNDDSVNPIPNTAEASYEVLVSQSGDVFSHTVYSDTVLTFVTKCNLRQPGVDLLESIALVQTALSHIINAEGEKLQKAVELDVSAEDMIKINDSVANMTQSVLVLEGLLLSKAELIKPQISCG